MGFGFLREILTDALRNIYFQVHGSYFIHELPTAKKKAIPMVMNDPPVHSGLVDGIYVGLQHSFVCSKVLFFN